MITSFRDQEIKNLFSVQEGKGLRYFITAAHGKAKELIAHGEMIREKHNDGNVNSSPKSTKDGAVDALDDMMRRPLFGNRIRWAKRTLRDFFGR